MENRTLRRTVSPSILPASVPRRTLAEWRTWLASLPGADAFPQACTQSTAGLQLRIENRRLRRVDGLDTEAEIRRACVDFLPPTSEERLSVRQWTDRLQPRLKHNVIRRCLAEHDLLRDDGLYTEADIKLACADMLDPTLPTVGVFQGS